MYVCICKGITEKEIKETHIKNSLSAEQFMDSEACQAGKDCGSCRQFVKKILTPNFETQRPQ